MYSFYLQKVGSGIVFGSTTMDDGQGGMKDVKDRNRQIDIVKWMSKTGARGSTKGSKSALE